MLNQLAQSLRAAGGTAFEYIVAKILNSFLLEDDIVVTRAREASLSRLIHNQSNLYQIMDFTRVPVKRRCDQSQLQDYPDLDLFALVRPSQFGELWRLLAIINCKVSFHARHTEAAFWGLLIRLSSNIPFVVVTEDRDIYTPKASELGRSCEDSTETRRILESFSDRVYLVKRYTNENDPKLDKDISIKQNNLKQGILSSVVFDDVNIPYHTQYCHSVRPIDDLIDDLRHWKAEIPK
ncbi:MAG: hypothetical protein DRI01_07025 [Chloroflexi bacterium]|nr:MAG: hypothetical protein DRI01_07025 [Chloroflexota bacterium]